MNRKHAIALAILIIIVSIPIFLHLDVIPIQIWDEGRFAVQALNILKTNNWLVMQYHGVPDMWLVKPPFMMWLQAIGMQIAGYGELAIRLPAALAALGTCILLFYLFIKEHKGALPGIVCALVLVTAPGYVIIHGTRTGECDSLLVFFMTGYAISFFQYLKERKPKYLVTTFVLLSCAGLTKGIEALLILPGLLLYAVYKKQVWNILKEKMFYLGMVAFLFLVPGFYLLREHYNPGFIARVLESEVFGRYNTIIEAHKGGPLEYIYELLTIYFSYWSLPAIAGLILGLRSKERAIKDITVFSGIIAATYLAIISKGQTKVYWYLLPVFPFLSILAGICLYTIAVYLEKMNMPGLKRNAKTYSCIFLAIIFMAPYLNICNYVLSNKSGEMADNRYHMQQYLKDMLRHADKNRDGAAILNDDINHDLEWYIMALEVEHRPSRIVSRDELRADERVIVYSRDSKKYLEEHYKTAVIDTFEEVSLYKLEGRKSAIAMIGSMQ